MERSSQLEWWEVTLPDWAEKTAIIFLPFLGFSLQFLSACPLAALMKGLLCMTYPSSRANVPRVRPAAAMVHQGQSKGPCTPAQGPEGGWNSCCWKRGAQPPYTDFAKFIPTACTAPFLLINPGLQSTAPSHQGRRNKGGGNEAPRETQRATLVSPSAYGTPKARKHSHYKAY